MDALRSHTNGVDPAWLLNVVQRSYSSNYTESGVIVAGPAPKWLSGNIGDIIKRSAFHYYIDNARVYGKLFKVGSAPS